MKKQVCILGSTGSVGTQAIEVVRERGYRLTGICADGNISLLEDQIREFHPLYCAVRNEEKAKELKIAVSDTDTKILSGEEGILTLCRECPADIVENSVLGSNGILPTMELLRAGKDIAMANKEPIVAAGEIILRTARENGARILPVDSEHSAIFQCMSGGFNDRRYLSHLVLTASGGPFFGKRTAELEKVTPEMALAHPVWNMGQKISIDSATLLNKGLELIEAVRLFDVPADQVEITVHRQSIVHSMATFVDGSTIAQMGHPDMRHCIQFALTYPQRTEGLCKPLDFTRAMTLTFEGADEDTFTLLKTARRAAMLGGTYTTVLNAANESCVRLFLDRRISFLDIFRIVEEEVALHTPLHSPDISDILALDRETKEKVLEKYAN
ncbi:MAG: 1-deoxy-D-xylulose-5-phosphate reductoisomerase [Ruminococcaceae bacterium]|nr:1-deoxy-D-xylulose-5-phosphate reductoisomerase [Oscillospiraceae bacterium]